MYMKIKFFSFYLQREMSENARTDEDEQAFL